MNVMVIGSGGREHAIVRALKKSPEITRLWCLPGNGGIAADAECVDIGAKDIPAAVDFAVQNNVDFAVVPTESYPNSGAQPPYSRRSPAKRVRRERGRATERARDARQGVPSLSAVREDDAGGFSFQ